MSNDRGSLMRDTRGLTLTELVVTLALFAMVMAGVVGTWGKAQEAYFIGSESAEVQQNVRAAIDFMLREIRSTGRDVTVCAFDYATAATTDCDAGKVTVCTNRMASSPGPPTWETGNGVGGPGCTGVYAIPFAQATATTLRIRSDRNGNGRIAGLGNAVTAGGGADRGEEDVLYSLASGNPPCTTSVGQCITRDDGTGPQAMVAVDINGLTFTYYPRANFGPCAGVPNPCNNAFALPLTSQAQADNIGRIRIQVQARQTTAGSTISRTLITEVALRNRS
jgi:prepilin-type N-terminal cleavage/methylation domain-containing protein